MMREKVARIIDPSIWETRDYLYALPDGVRTHADRAVEPSLAKADAILALTAPARGDGAEEHVPSLDEAERHELTCLRARIQQIEYPCSPHCDGYLREMALRNSAPAAPAGDWRPIESAPRDGTSVDLWIEPVEESPDSFYLHNEAHRCANTYYSNYHWHGAEWPWKPTHWQPLPLPPAPVEEG